MCVIHFSAAPRYYLTCLANAAKKCPKTVAYNEYNRG